MAETDEQVEAEQPQPAESGLEHGTYEVIRNRLRNAARGLRTRLDKLNAARKDVFGAIETKLLATERVTTGNNCIPRDMTPVGDCFLFGYNVHIGLKSTTSLEDIFSIYAFRDHTFAEQSLELIDGVTGSDNERFRRDFAELFRYYKKTVFARFAVIGPHLYMVFRVSEDVKDIKAFKWLIQHDRLVYIDARSDHEVRFPPQHGFEWQRTHRDMHLGGLYPHVSIEDRLFVEAVGGDLTIKIENNTESGEGIYAEPVDNPDQTLDDAEIFYSIVGNLILLKILPYQEQKYRYFAYSEKTQQVVRLDVIENACVLLPDGHGLIFPNGYFLQTGEYKVFESGLLDMVFTRRVASPNGEDFLYVFYNRASGTYILLPYNLIEQKIETPIICSGFSLFEDGEMLYFKSQDEPQKHHAVQIWQTPYVGADYHPETQSDSLLYKIGNRDVVRGMAECHELLGLIAKEDTYANLFIDLSKKVTDVIDSYYWLGNDEAFNLREDLEQIKEAAAAAISEFEKVVSVRRNTDSQTKKVVQQTREIASSIHSRRFEVIGDFVGSLVDLRSVRGEIISLRDLRYVDAAQIDALEKEVEEHTERVAKDCVLFLLNPESLQPYADGVEEHRAKIDGLKKVADAKELEEKVSGSASELEMLIEVVSNLKIDDATQRTAIIDGISGIFSQLNQVRATLKTRMQELGRVEGVAEFNSQVKLLNQGVVNYLDICDTPTKCEEYLTKMMVQIEELEGRFAEFDEFVLQLTEKREEIYNAFETRKLQLIEARNRRATTLMNAAERILKGVKARVGGFKTINEINGYLAADLMIEKVRNIVADLAEMGDTVKVDDVQSRLKVIREDAVRQLKDRQDLYEDGENVIRLGTHKFSVNNQTVDLTTVLRDGEAYYHLTGTAFFEQIKDPEFLDTRSVWSQEVVSENDEVYRGEYLACQMLQAAGTASLAADADTLRAADDEGLLGHLQQFMGPRYSEGYVKGVHDHDAAIILRALLQQQATIGLLRYHPRARALASVFWFQLADQPTKEMVTAKLEGFGTVQELFPETDVQQRYVAELEKLIAQYAAATGIFPEFLAPQAAEYLFEVLTHQGNFAISPYARDLYQAFEAHLQQTHFAEKHDDSMEDVQRDANAAFLLHRDWVTAFLATRPSSVKSQGPANDDYADEVASLLLTESFDVTRVVDAAVAQDLTGMVGNHPLIRQNTYHLDYNTLVMKLERFRREVVPRFEAYQRLKKELVDSKRDEMRLDEFRPRVLTTFVRNKLIDQVYLRLLGDNLAKQVGVVGEQKRTDRMGLLLLISPPGYGKTTLMEYLANRLGIIFMKINGPALGNQVTSLDPAEAPNAAAREEVHKLNLAFEMGDNVMIYVDDIQHCNPEFLQKFISLCDAQRRIEGVYRDKTRTYDLRGKKVAVVMAGNPYTESGEKFKIPDMLANRADTYNLGEIIGDTADEFEMSYLENSLTSNPVLNKLAARSQQDVYAVIRMAREHTVEGVDLEGAYSMAEVNEMVSVMQKLMRVRDVVLKVNAEYIRSASMGDDYRTEPAFKLQGSYRNMNRIAERVVAVMNDAELDNLIYTTYQNDAQTLTTGTESNMLKFKDLNGWLAPEDAVRWESIKKTFGRNVKLKGVGDDAKFGQLIVELTSFSDGLDAIKGALDTGLDRMLQPPEQPSEEVEPQPLTASFDAATLKTIRTAAGDFKSALSERGGPDTTLMAVESIRAVAQEVKSALAQRQQPDTAAASVEAVKTAVESLKTALAERPAAEPAAAAPPTEVHVVSKVPSVILAVLRQQFKLMEGWLKPIHDQTRAQSEDIRNLRRLIDENLATYGVLIEQLEEAARQDEDLYEKLAKHKILVERPKRGTKKKGTK